MMLRMGRPAVLPSVAEARPDLAAQWSPTNTKTPDQVSIGSAYKAEFICDALVAWPDGQTRACAHAWLSTVANRALNGQGCPACAGKAAAAWNNLAALHRDLAAQWHPTANDRTPTDVTAGSGYRATWLCPTCDHTWVTQVDKRANRGHGCPGCSGKAVSAKNNLGVLRPDLAAQWHPDNPIGPDAVTVFSNRRVRWLCSTTVVVNDVERVCGHEWTTSPAARTRAGCPACGRFAASEWNNLTVTHPDLVGEWHPNNDMAASEVSMGSGYRARWICRVNDCGHEWEATVANRAVNGRGCPACSGNVVTPSTSLAATHPTLCMEWDHTRNTLTPADVSAGSDYLAWWRCSISATDDGEVITCGHRWRTRVANRARLGNACPRCVGHQFSRAEFAIGTELSQFYSQVSIGHHRVKAGVRTFMVDVALPADQVIVEYDSAHWHRGRERHDNDKSAALEAAGWRVIRIREEPLHGIEGRYVTVPRAAKDDVIALAAVEAVAALTGRAGDPAILDYLAEGRLRRTDDAARLYRERSALSLIARHRRDRQRAGAAHEASASA